MEGSQDSFLIKQVDSDACFETYKHHCVQLEEAITSYDVRQFQLNVRFVLKVSLPQLKIVEPSSLQ